MLDLNLKNKTAIVGGASQGIGRAVAIELAAAGANLVLISRNEEGLQETLNSLPKARGQKHLFLKADFAHPPMLLAELENYIARNSKPVHIIVNNTGGPAPGPANAAASDEFIAAFRQHLICNHVLMQTFLPGMKEAGYGRIINIISTSVKAPLLNLGVSNTVRAAVANWSKTLSVELAPFGITVNNVLPGATSTGRLQHIINNKADKAEKSVALIEKEMLKEIPAGRFAGPEEIAYAVAFLASPAAAYINGINLPVDGGRTACL
jgi:3-oxoacyl-[acyl-carrier protein] reductase